jgi:ADP-heptose:LPS heptosyltransferase
MNASLQMATPGELIAEFLNEFNATGNYRRDLIARLAALATDENVDVTESATTALFASLVERLADSFSPDDVSLYNRVFAQIIDYCRRLDRGQAIDAALNDYGLHDEADVLRRAESLRHPATRPPLLERGASVRRVILLSRVTLGADVAINSVIMDRCKQEFPDAEIVLIGGRKAAELFGGDERITFREIHYRRGGATLERLLSWLDVLEVVNVLTADSEPQQWLIVDPDSRLTQLGLLPLTRHKDNYLFFPSREYGATSADSLGQLTAAWLDEIFDSPRPVLSSLSLRRDDLAAATALTQALRQANARPIITVNFGVGENPAKRISDEFEQSLVTGLIQSGATVILDKGASADEIRRANAVIAKATQAAASVIDLTAARLAEGLNHLTFNADLLTWDGSIGMLAALIAQSDLYIGYDSAGQHIAAAAGTPCIDVFAGYSSARMLDRWRPSGRAATHVIVVDTERAADAAGLLSTTFAIVRQERESKGGYSGNEEI